MVRGGIKVLREADIRAALDMSSGMEACRSAFVAYVRGGAEQPGVIHLEVPESHGEIHVKAGYVHGEAHYAVKMASGFYGSGLSLVDGLVAVFDARTGAPAAFLLDGGYITDLRTGAAGGVAASLLAPSDVRTIAVIGTGGQARQQVDALLVARPGFDDLRVWGRSVERADACVTDLRSRVGASCVVRRSATIRDAVEGADVVVTCTASCEPLVERAWLKEGAHVTAVGSDESGKQELDPTILRDADLLVVDSRDQCRRLGELQHALDQADRSVEIGLVCAGEHPGRTAQEQLTVCDLTGLGVQDIAAANIVLQRAAERGDLIER